MPVYATADDLTPYLTNVPENVDVLLARASRLVDQTVLCAVYNTDAEGYPVDERIADALRDATCEQVTAWVAGGEDGTGAADQYASVSIGSVSLTRGGGSGTAGTGLASRLAPQAWMILHQAGLVNRGPWVG